ncbi:MAG: SDR family NAD(P)-dependent oxidoreductase [Myxococcus sp.]|nr:SDR family NAD(P)-dependent oxidoreductase [Myxococcus sp.]
MTNPTMLVTGATDGIGLQTALQLAQGGARVLVHGRSEARAVDAVKRLGAAGVKGAVPVWADLSVMAQVTGLAEQVRRHTDALDVLVNNAGVFMTEDERTADGFELTFAVNHFAPVLLTHALLGALEQAPAARVVNVSSVAHARGQVTVADLPVPRAFDGYGVYGASKLLNVLFTHALARRLAARGSRVVTFALHPGVITTKLLEKGFGMAGASVESGARTSVFCATSPRVGASGSYYSDAREVPCAPHANDPALEAAVYEKSCQLVGCAPL